MRIPTINLIYSDKSDIGFKIDSFPDGHEHIKLNRGFNKYNKVDIKCRIKDGDDLFILMQLFSILSKVEVEVNNLYIYYLLGARMDRQMSIEESIDLEIVSKMLSNHCALYGTDIHFYDIHSYKIRDYWNNKLHSLKFNTAVYAVEDLEKYLICFPDEGASERYNCPTVLHNSAMFNDICREKNTIYCKKNRDPETNKLSGFEIINFEEHKEKFDVGQYAIENPILVVDDICDLGGTFVGIAEKLRELNPTSLSLFVTHAIQLEGIKRVAEVYDEVFITNSYYNWEEYWLPENVTVINIVNV